MHDVFSHRPRSPTAVAQVRDCPVRNIVISVPRLQRRQDPRRRRPRRFRACSSAADILSVVVAPCTNGVAVPPEPVKYLFQRRLYVAEMDKQSALDLELSRKLCSDRPSIFLNLR